MIVQIAAYDPNYYKENTLVFSDLYFPDFLPKTAMVDDIWSYFLNIDNLYSTTKVKQTDNWLVFTGQESPEYRQQSQEVEGWTDWSWNLESMIKTSLVELDLEGWSDFFLPKNYMFNNTDTERKEIYGRISNQNMPDTECPVQLRVMQTVQNALVGHSKTSYPVTDNHIVEVYTTYIGIMPEPTHVYPPSTH